MDVPTPPAADFTINFESDAENVDEDAEKDRVDDEDEPPFNINVPGVGNLDVIYVDSMAPTPPESETQTQDIEDEVPQQPPTATQKTPEQADEVLSKTTSTTQQKIPDKVPLSKFNFKHQSS